MDRSEQDASAQSLDQLKAELYTLLQRFRRGAPPAQLVHGMSPGEMHLLHYLDDATREGCLVQPSDIARNAGVTPSAVSQAIKKLEGKGFVERVRSTHDSRRVHLALTRDGAAFAQECRRDREAFMDDLCAYIGEDKLRNLNDALRRISEFCAMRASEFAADGEAPDFSCAASRTSGASACAPCESASREPYATSCQKGDVPCA